MPDIQQEIDRKTICIPMVYLLVYVFVQMFNAEAQFRESGCDIHSMEWTIGRSLNDPVCIVCCFETVMRKLLIVCGEVNTPWSGMKRRDTIEPSDESNSSTDGFAGEPGSPYWELRRR